MIDDPNQVFINSHVNSVFTPYTGIHHSEYTGRNKRKFDPPHINGSYKTGNICNYASANAYQEGFPVGLQLNELIYYSVNCLLILMLLSSFDNYCLPT